MRIDGIHVGEFVHIVNENVDFDDFVDRSTRCFEDMSQVFDALVLLCVVLALISLAFAYFLFRGQKEAYSASLDVSLNQLSSHRVHANGTRAVYYAIGDDGLRVDTGQGLGGLFGQDGGFGGHVSCLDGDICVGRKRKMGEKEIEDLVL